MERLNVMHLLQTGTGGTLAGVGLYLKQKKPSIKIVLADPPGSALYSYKCPSTFG